MPSIVRVQNLHKTYRLGRAKVPVLRGVDLDVEEGEWVGILGQSGSGKSTLLHLVGGLDRPDRESRASIEFDGANLGSMSRADLDRYRSRSVGFVFQFYHLLPEMRVLENVTVGSMIRHGRLGYRGETKHDVEQRAKEVLGVFGLGDRLRHRPNELSGGERQRVAIARALINRPRLLLADEPTGNLDRETGGTIIDAIAELRDRFGLTIVMVTHDQKIADRADRVVRLVDGRVEDAAPAFEG
ncbi:MAG: ABC transporter ATP-binding protein [Planctomycetota bacterium]